MKNKKIMDYFITFLFLLLIFQRYIALYIPQFTYLDEIITVFLVTLSLLRIIKNKNIKKEDIKLLLLLFLMIIVGLIGNKTSGYNRKLDLKIDAIIYWFKSFLTFICGYIYFYSKELNSNQIIRNITKITKIVVLTAFILFLISPITKFGIEYNSAFMRYGLYPYKFIFSKASIFSWYCILYMLILTADNSINKKNNFKYLLMVSIFWAFTLRSRAIAFIAIYWILYLYIFKYKRKENIKIKKNLLIIVGIVGVVLAMPAIDKYFVNNTTSRSVLLKTGINIGVKYFPLGVGLANYGSTPAFKEYSKVYYDYGFNSIYGLRNSGESNELVDTYWPSIIAEFGFLGLVILITFMYKVFKRIIINSKTNKWIYMCSIFFVITSLYSSIATAVFSADIMIAYMFFIVLTCFIKPKEAEK